MMVMYHGVSKWENTKMGVEDVIEREPGNSLQKHDHRVMKRKKKGKDIYMSPFLYRIQNGHILQ
jgi:hypothetical protein